MAATRGAMLIVVVQVACLVSLGDGTRKLLPRSAGWNSPVAAAWNNSAAAAAASFEVKAALQAAHHATAAATGSSIAASATEEGPVPSAWEGFLTRWGAKRPATALVAMAQSARSFVSPRLQSLFAGLSFAAGIKFACMAGNVFYTVSPFTEVQDWEAKGSTGNVDAAPYIMMAFNGCQWCLYGFAAWQIKANDGFLILVYANCLGAMLGFYYTCTFYKHCRNHSTSSNLKQYAMFVLAVALFEISMWLVLMHERALLLHSILASFCSFMGALSILTVVPTVLRTGDAVAICGPLCAANLIGGLLWAYWGSMMKDFSVMVPNTFAACASGICLCIKVLYTTSRSDGRDAAIDKMGDKMSAS